LGTFVYGPSQLAVEFDDRSLAHLQFVIVAKLRRAESFQFSWENPADDQRRRTAVWLNPAIALEFHFAEAAAPALSRPWLEQLAAVASSTSGLRLLPEPPEGGS
jgi:hypothetical protein